MINIKSISTEACTIMAIFVLKSTIRPAIRALLVLLFVTLILYVVYNGLIIQPASAASPPGVAWQKTYGGPGDDEARSVRQCPDGGYIVAGYTYSFGNGGSDVYLVKADGSGNLQWSRTYGGSGDDLAYAVNLTRDGGYIITGYTYSFGNGGSDVYLVKTDGSGNLQWSKTYGGAANDSGCSVFQAVDGGYVIGGYTSSFGNGSNDFYLIKTDASGNLQWSRTYGGPGDDDGKDIIPTSDGGYAFLGYTDSYGNGSYAVYLVKTNATGDVQWTRTYGGSGRDFGQFIRQTTDGGYVIAGLSAPYSNNGVHDALMIKTDSMGNAQWIKVYGGSNFDEARAVQQMSDGGYVLAGQTDSFGNPNGDLFVVKTDSNGNAQWTSTYGGSGISRTWSMDKTLDGGVIIAGATTSYGNGSYDVYLVKLNQIVPTPTPTPTPTVAPTAGFTVAPNKGNFPLFVQVTNTATNATTYNYSWGDNTANSTTPAPTHTYNAAGTYTVIQTVTNSNGSASATQTVTVTTVAPTVTPTVTPTPSPSPQPAVYNVSTTHRWAVYNGTNELIEQFLVNPGTTVAQSVLYNNTGTRPDSYNVSVTGIPSSWWRSTLYGNSTVQPGDGRYGNVNITPTTKGTYPFNVTVTSNGNKFVSSTQSYTLYVSSGYNVTTTHRNATYYGTNKSIERMMIFPGTTVSQSVYYLNTGTKPDSYNVSVTGIPSTWWKFTLNGASTVNPGDGRYGNLAITPRSFGTYTFTVRVTSKGDSTVYSTQTYTMHVL